jgi:hypothetical protein
MAASMASMSADVKFTPDQCRVLKQVGVDTTGICPPASKKKARPR